jgi:hypothetical protein
MSFWHFLLGGVAGATLAEPSPTAIYGMRASPDDWISMSTAMGSAACSCSSVNYVQPFRSAAEAQNMMEQQRAQLEIMARQLEMQQQAKKEPERPKKPIFHCPYCDRGYWDIPPHTCRGCGAGLA